MYYVVGDGANQAKTMTIMTNMTTGIIPDLLPNTQYVVRVIAINGATTNSRSEGSQQQTGMTEFGGKSSMD